MVTNNPIEQINQRKVAALTEPDIASKYLLLTLETVQQDSGILFDSWEQHCKKTMGFNIRTSDASGFKTDLITMGSKRNGNAQGSNRQDDSIEYSTKDKLSWQFIFQKCNKISYGDIFNSVADKL